MACGPARRARDDIRQGEDVRHRRAVRDWRGARSRRGHLAVLPRHRDRWDRRGPLPRQRAGRRALERPGREPGCRCRVRPLPEGPVRRTSRSGTTASPNSSPASASPGAGSTRSHSGRPPWAVTSGSSGRTSAGLGSCGGSSNTCTRSTRPTRRSCPRIAAGRTRQRARSPGIGWARARELWSGRLDSNQRPPEPHSGALPGCATPRPRLLARLLPDSGRRLRRRLGPRLRARVLDARSRLCRGAFGGRRPARRLTVAVQRQPPLATAPRPTAAARLRRLVHAPDQPRAARATTAARVAPRSVAAGPPCPPGPTSPPVRSPADRRPLPRSCVARPRLSTPHRTPAA